MHLRYLVLIIAALSSFAATSMVTAFESTASVATSPRLTRSIADGYDGGANKRSLRSVETTGKNDEERVWGLSKLERLARKYEEKRTFKRYFRNGNEPKDVGLRSYEKYYNLMKKKELAKQLPK
ncbi:hypothetical protein PHYBOEH_009192 [Phytophthora boehmeriae]|uniref:RxLR effector protein n=1 Tax=Phytophthora boehmeriae TaxID=109152 RepID=A0A8T1VUK8_9STRA|nr:hypothetical protein PHYBOEH_009192 [Phytophthora boehmeriae]